MEDLDECRVAWLVICFGEEVNKDARVLVWASMELHDAGVGFIDRYFDCFHLTGLLKIVNVEKYKLRAGLLKVDVQVDLLADRIVKEDA